MKTSAALFGGMGTVTHGYHAAGKINGQGNDVVPVLESNWRAAAVEKLKEYKSLRPNWNSYGSPPPSEIAIQNAISFLMMMSEESSPRPRLTPIAGGGIQFEWNYGERALEFEFRPDGTFEYLWVPDRNSEGTEVPIPRISRREIELLMAWLTGG